MNHPAPNGTPGVTCTLQENVVVPVEVIDSWNDGTHWRYDLQFQQTNGNNVDTAGLTNVLEVYVHLPDDKG